MTLSLPETLFTMAMALFGAPAEVTLLASALPACEARDQTARHWRKTRPQVFVHNEAAWCIVASLHRGAWHAEQWQREDAPLSIAGGVPASGNKKSHGWSVKMPLNALPAPGIAPQVHRLAPGVEVAARHYPGMTPSQAHRQMLSMLLPPSELSAASRPAIQGPSDYLLHRFPRGQATVTLLTMHADGLGTVQVQLTEAQP
jgi:hypothetical protein